MPATYPAELTNATWQKNKGTLGRATTETGIGASLTALEKAFKSSSFVTADPKALAAETTDPMVYLRLRERLRKTLENEAKNLTAKIQACEQRASAATTTFADNSKVLGHLSQLIKDLEAFDNDLPKAYAAQVIGDVDRQFKANFGKTKTAAVLKSPVAADTEKARKAAMAMIKKVETAKTLKSIHATFGSNGPHRVVSTTPKLWDQIFSADCPQLTTYLLPGQAMTVYFGLPWVSDVGDEAGNKASDKVAANAKKSNEARAVETMALQYSRSLVEYKKFTDALAKFTTAVRPYC